MFYVGVFFLTLTLSTIFSMAGAGAGIALIPILHFIGIPFDISRVTGLFVGFSTTATSTLLNFRRGVLEVGDFLPLALSLPISAALGAQLSRFVDSVVIEILFSLFLLFSATMMLFFKKKPRYHLHTPLSLVVTGTIVGLVAGLLGVGGGNLLLPILILLGFEARRVAVAVSFVIPFSSASSFLSYASFVDMDWTLLAVSALGAIAGASIGNHIMHERMSQRHIRMVIAMILYLLALKMLISLS